MPHIQIGYPSNLEGHLARFAVGGIQNLTGGKDVAGDGTFETRSPVNARLIAQVALGMAATVDAAAKAARGGVSGMGGAAGRSCTALRI